MERVWLSQNDFPGDIADFVAHRPWPLPSEPWVMSQSWHELLFAHWPVDPSLLAALVPPEFTLDLHDGRAWLGVVPFLMTNVAPRHFPALPWVSQFAELNVRTYVRVHDRPGVFFFSLDAANALAVRVARYWLGLPYFTASMSVERSGDEIHYRSHRAAEESARFEASYRPSGPMFHPEPGSLEHFLTERYCLYGRNRRGRPYRLEIHHPPWSLHAAEASLRHNSIAQASGVLLPAGPPLLHFAKRQDTLTWGPHVLD